MISLVFLLNMLEPENLRAMMQIQEGFAQLQRAGILPEYVLALSIHVQFHDIQNKLFFVFKDGLIEDEMNANRV